MNSIKIDFNKISQHIWRITFFFFWDGNNLYFYFQKWRRITFLQFINIKNSYISWELLYFLGTISILSFFLLFGFNDREIGHLIQNNFQLLFFSSFLAGISSLNCILNKNITEKELNVNLDHILLPIFWLWLSTFR